MSFLKGVLHFFIPRERTLVYTTFDQADYLKVKSNLIAAAIPHRTRIEGGSRDMTRRTHIGGGLSVQHDLFVSKEDEHRALMAIR